MDLSRRRFLAGAAAAPLALAGCAAGAPKSDPYAGVKIGVQTYSYHDIPVDGANHAAAIIAHMKENGLTSCELFGAQIEPSSFMSVLPSPADCPKPEIGCAPGKGGSARNAFAWVFTRRTGEEAVRARAALKAHRESRNAAYYEAIRRQFSDAGIEIYTYNPIFDLDCSDAEIDGIFYAAKALGVKAINSSIRTPALRRAIPFAEKHRMIIAPHGHSVVSDPEDFSTRKTFTDAFALSPWVWANLDIGHYTASGEDCAEFINAFHDRITNLHVKDRTRNKSVTVEDGANVPWGQGDTPINDVLRLLRDKKYPIPGFIEIEHMGTTTAVGEVAAAADYCRKALAA